MTIIAQLEQAVEGSRELDNAIALAVDGFIPNLWNVPRYTTSLDAALTLVEWMGFLLKQNPDGQWRAWIDCDGKGYNAIGCAKIPTLASCALKARGLGS